MRDWARHTGTCEVRGTEGIPAESGAGNTCLDVTSSGQAYLRLGEAVRLLGFHNAWEVVGRRRQGALQI